nr:PAS domain-containing protein [uncultured Pseudodesulfovibrio sp.]
MTRDIDTETAPSNHTLPMQDLRSFVDDFPALLWRIEIARSRIEFLNDYSLHPLGDSARLFLKNISFRKQMLLPEDAHLLDVFFEAVREGRTMATVFRVHTPADGIMWLKLTGAVNSSDPRYYYGYLLDVGDTVDVIRDIQKTDAESRLRIDNVPTPVILMNHQSLRIKQANAAARDLFALPRAMNGLLPHFTEISPKTNDDIMESILQDLPNRPWNGTLDLCSAQGEPLKANVEFQWVPWKQSALIRVSALPICIGKEKTSKAQPENTRAIFNEAANISDMLRRVLELPEIGKRCNAVMLSDIQTRRKTVVVTGVGAPLADMTPGEKFSYKGTIAEDIARFKIDHLVVDDTLDSIKPIDWALFIPRGIRSYYAKPYYTKNILRTVLILCSTEPNRFVDFDAKAFDSILTPLNDAIAAKRKK